MRKEGYEGGRRYGYEVWNAEKGQASTERHE
jgi:hypothetical protein